MAAIDQRFFPHRQRLCWLPRRQVPHAQRQGGEVAGCRKSGGENQNGGPGSFMFALMSRRVWSRVEEAGRSGQPLPLGEAGRSGLRRFDRLDAGMAETDTEDMALICSLPSCRQLGQANGEFRGSGALPGECPPPPSLASGMEARRVKTRAAGLQRSRQPGPKGDAQIIPSTRLIPLGSYPAQCRLQRS